MTNHLSTRDIYLIVGQNVRRLRKERMWPQEMLGHFSGMHPTAVARVERSERQCRLDTIVKLAKALKVSVDSLLVEHREGETPA